MGGMPSVGGNAIRNMIYFMAAALFCIFIKKKEKMKLKKIIKPKIRKLSSSLCYSILIHYCLILIFSLFLFQIDFHLDCIRKITPTFFLWERSQESWESQLSVRVKGNDRIRLSGRVEIWISFFSRALPLLKFHQKRIREKHLREKLSLESYPFLFHELAAIWLAPNSYSFFFSYFWDFRVGKKILPFESEPLWRS